MFARFYTSEFTTIARNATSVTWPTVPLYRLSEG